MYSNPHLSAALEAIDFQRDEMLLKELSIQISSLMGTEDKQEQLKILQNMNKVAFNHSGVKFNFHLLAEKQPNAFIFVPDSTSAAPMRPESLGNALRKAGGIPSEKELFKGSIDLRTGKASGIYSEIPLDVCFSMAFLRKTPKGNYFAPEETAAVLIHEMGHGVMYLRWLGGLVISNIVVAEICAKVHEGADPVIVREIIKVAEQKTGYKIKDLGTIDKNTDPLVIQQVIMAEMVEKIRSDLGTRYYDARAFEFVADQFAARHGGAAHIVSALDRMYREFGYTPTEYSGRMGQFILALADNVKLILSVAGGYASYGAGAAILGGALSIVFGLAVACIFTILGGGEIYDDIPNRFKAMRRELIASSKDTNLTQAQRAKILADIQTVDQALSNLTVTWMTPGFLRDWFAGVVTGKTGQMKFMRQLEELANNRLFELSNTLQAKA